MKIYLIGFMGCGKSTVGKKLAAQYGYVFLDTDSLFEKKYQCSISDFLASHTQEEFRKREQDILLKTQSWKNAVVATGGGTPCYEYNIEWMLSQGIVVYIEMPASALYIRLINSRKERPLLSNKENLQQEIETLLSQREPIYKKAHISISGIDIDVRELGKGIFRM